MDYTVNKAFIVANLCVDRLNKQSTCQGKCYLNKAIAENKQDADSSPKTVEQIETLQQFVLDHSSFKLTPHMMSRKEVEFYIKDASSSDQMDDVFHPPQQG